MNSKKITWLNLALMGFTIVWGFGNVVNGYGNFSGTRVSILWVLIMVLYFVPYSLMVGEMGSCFKNETGGVSSWVKKTLGSKWTFYAGWVYFVVNLPYLSQKPSTILVAASWAIFGKSYVSDLSIVTIQLVSLVIFLIALYLSTRGLSFLKKISSLAGMTSFVLSTLFILMMIAAPSIGIKTNALTWNDFKPDFSLSTLSNISILIFAVGGCEKISPYVNKLNNPEKDFPKGIIALTIMVIVSALLGTIAMGMMFDPNNIPSDLLTNGAYYAFIKLGEYYHLGYLLMRVYAIVNLICVISVIILSIDAPLQIFLNSVEKEDVPSWLLKQNDNGIYVNGLKLIGVVVGILILLPMLGIGDIDQLVKWLVKLNSVCMPFRYLWVFIAYIALKKSTNNYTSDFIFVKNKKLGIAIGLWCFSLTAISCVMGMISDNTFELIMNISTPVVLMLSGLLVVKLAHLEKH